MTKKKQSTSSWPDKPKKLSTGDILTLEAVTRLKALADRPDSEIDFSDIPPMSAERLASMIPLKQFLAMRMKKEPVTVRIDKDVLAWLRDEGDGYQTRMNQILRDAMAQAAEKLPREHASREGPL